jgi:S1-C subfamily serine protease
MNLNLSAGATLGLLFLLLVPLPTACAADDPRALATRKIFTNAQDSVLWVSAVAKVSFSAEGAKDQPLNLPDREDKVEALGTLIGTDGLVVAALNQLDPARNVTGREYRMAGGTVRIEATANLKEVKVTMPDGTDIPAEIVMKDTDLDLAFVRIKTASKEAKGVTLKSLDLKAAGAAQVGDEVVTIGRLDEVLYRVPNATLGQVNAVTRKPREFVRAAGAAQGCPTFLLDGRLLGIAATRSLKTRASHVVIIPAADVLEVAEQARHTPATNSNDTKP